MAWAKGASGDTTGKRTGLPRVMTRDTDCGRRRAISRARVPPRLRPTSATLPCRAAVSASCRSTWASTCGTGPRLRPGSTAGSWSSRLIFAYVGGRVFLDHPVLGTGWYGELPPEEYAQYLPDAHARFPDQPANYFPPADGTYIPQQAYDQVLYLLGIVDWRCCLPEAGDGETIQIEGAHSTMGSNPVVQRVVAERLART